MGRDSSSKGPCLNLSLQRYIDPEAAVAKRAEPLPPHVFQILVALADRDLHGLGIMNDVLDRSGGAIRLWPGMLYRNLQRLVDAGWIAEAPGPVEPEAGSPRYYRLTATGRKASADEAARLADLVAVARARKLLRKGQA
jgi:DNA-binding PadR family transcriptional regulator